MEESPKPIPPPKPIKPEFDQRGFIAEIGGLAIILIIIGYILHAILVP